MKFVAMLCIVESIDLFLSNFSFLTNMKDGRKHS